MDEGYQWLQAIANRMNEEIGRGAAASPESLTAKDLLWKFGFQRRGHHINKHIRKGLRKFKLRTVEDFTVAGLDSQITIEIDSDTPSSAPRPSLQAEPTHRIGTLKAARRKPVGVKPQSPLNEATLTMQMKNYSQLPVMRSDRDVSGIVTWRSINRRRSQGLECNSVNNCMDERVNVVSANSRLFEAVRTVVEHEYALVRGEHNIITGIVTATDLLSEVGQLAEPFLFIGEIERHLRHLIYGKFTLGQLKAAADDPEKVEGPADLTFGGHCRLLEGSDNWKQLGLNVDRKVFVKYLHSVRRIRNDVMHFDPNGLVDDEREELRDLARFFDKWRT